MVRVSILISVVLKENSIRLRFSSVLAVPRTWQIRLGTKFTSEAIFTKRASSFLGIIVAKVPRSESNIETASNRSSKGSASVNRAVSLDELYVL